MASMSQSAPEGKPFAADVKYVIKILLTIIESSKLAIKSSENLNTLNLLELYNKYLEVINEHFVHTDRECFEAFLVRGKKLKEYLIKSCRDHRTRRVRIFPSIVIVMLNTEDVKDEFTFPRFSACIAYNYYERVVSNLDNLDEMITPSLITGCSTLPMDTDDNKDNLKYNKLFCLAVSGVHFIPKMMKNAGKSDDLIGGVLTICLLIDYTQYKKKHIDDNVDFKTFLKSDQYREDRNNFINAVRNYGIVEIVELVEKESSFKMLQLFMRHGCTIELKGKYAREPRVYVSDLTGSSREIFLEVRKQLDQLFGRRY